jgi:hypothetical protein
MRLRTASALSVLALTSALTLAGCSVPEQGDPVTASELADIWTALGGDADDTTTGAAIKADELPVIEPAQCALVELVRSGAPYTVEDSTAEDPGMAGNLASPAAALEAGAGSDPTQLVQWYGSARVFNTETSASDYMAQLEEAAPECASYTTSFNGEDPTPTNVFLSAFDTGELPSVGFNEAVVMQKDNVVYVLWPASGVEDAQADINAFVNILQR